MTAYTITVKHAALFLLILLAAEALRVVHLGADPPLALSTSNSEVMDGPWYLAEAADAARGRPCDVPGNYRRPIFTTAARAAFALGGVSLETAQVMEAAFGVLLVVFGALGAYAAYGTRAALLAALFLATSYVLVWYGRVPLIYGPLAALLAGAYWLHVLGVRRHPAFHALALALVGAVAVGLSPFGAIAFLPASAACVVVAARYRGRALALVLLAGGGAALAFREARPDLAAELVGKVQFYFGSDVTPLQAVKRIANAPTASGLALKAPVLLAIAWVGVLLAAAWRPLREFESVVDRRLDDALDAMLAAWLAGAILLHAPFQFAPQEGLVPLRHFAGALVPAAVLAARTILRLAEGVEVAVPRSIAFVWALAGGYVAVACGWSVAMRIMWTEAPAPAAVPQWFRIAASFFGILGVALVPAFLVARRLGDKETHTLRLGTVGAVGSVVLALAADAYHFAPFLCDPGWTLRFSNEVVARKLPPGSVVEGPFAHALTYEANVERHFLTFVDTKEDPILVRRRFTHLLIDERWGPEIERTFRRWKQPLEPPLELYVRGYPVRVYRYAWGTAGGGGASSTPPGTAPMGPDSR